VHPFAADAASAFKLPMNSTPGAQEQLLRETNCREISNSVQFLGGNFLLLDASAAILVQNPCKMRNI